MSLPLDTDAIRALFPAFAEPGLKGWAFFENAGGSYTASHVINRLGRFYKQTKVQPYGYYPASKIAGEAMDYAYARMAKAMNLSPDWVHFGPSTSANTYVLAHAFAEVFDAGDAIIVTNQDHEANSGALRRLEKKGITIREWQVDQKTGCLDIESLDNLLDDKVRLIAFPHCSNIIGHINPAAEICKRAAEAGALTIVDGVSYAPHGIPDIAEMGADIYLFSAYKTFGPHLGVMAVRPELAAVLPNQGHFFNDTKPRYRLTPAGPDHAQIAASAGIVDYLVALAKIAGHKTGSPFQTAREAIHAQEQAMLQPLLEWLNTDRRVHLIGPTEANKRAPTLSLIVGEPPADLAARLVKHKIMAGAGGFYAHRLLQALKIDPAQGVLRLSFVHYTEPSEIIRLIEALDAELK